MTDNSPNLLYLGRSSKELNAAVMKEISRFYAVVPPIQDISGSPYIMCVNCLQHQSISYVRKNLAFFAKMVIRVPKGLRKTIILIDADFLSGEAQAALRRSIEVNNHTTRFIITTKRFGAIQDPILSRFKTVDVSPPIVDEVVIPAEECQANCSSRLMHDVEELIAQGRTRGILDNNRRNRSTYSICLHQDGCRCDYLVSLYATLIRRHD